MLPFDSASSYNRLRAESSFLQTDTVDEDEVDCDYCMDYPWGCHGCEHITPERKAELEAEYADEED